jgi:eukaryotic-like serine/threonine-protein kinase
LVRPLTFELETSAMPLDTSKPALTEIGNYEILARIAEGTVYKARRRSDGLITAIKIIPSTAARNQILLQRFKREFNAARQIDHPHVVKAIEFCELPPNPYLVMEFVDGESLGQKLEREGKLSEAEATRIMAQVCQGLHRAHKQNLIHRDVKPDNVLLTMDGVAKITDLGLVKDIEGEMNLTRTGRGLGTPHFMAPEQFRNAKHADIRCDIYSLGATMYMMVTGKMPFDGCGPLDAWMKKSNNEFPAPREIDPTISERMDWAIRRAMHADPESRPATCREFIEDVTGQSTRPSHVPNNPSADLWYMVYRDDEGTVHTVKGTTENIRKAFREGLLGDASNIRACRSKQGPFQPLQGYPEFRDLVVSVEDIERSGGGPLRNSSNGASRRPTAPISGVPTPPNPTVLPDERRKNAVAVEATVQYPNEELTVAARVQANRDTSVPSSTGTAEHEPYLDRTTLTSPNRSNTMLWAVIAVLAVMVGVLSVMVLMK